MSPSEPICRYSVVPTRQIERLLSSEYMSKRTPLFTEYAQLRRVAICPPQFFRLGEPINVIQVLEAQRGIPISAERASAEHAALAALVSKRSRK